MPGKKAGSHRRPTASPRGIVVFCDGTGNDLFRTSFPSNVRLLHRHIADEDKTILYFRGVGVSEYDGSLNKYVDGIGGFSVGYSIKSIYSSIVHNYQPGAEIFLFGYSRGAYIIRSLSSLIRKFGILRRRFHSGKEINRVYSKYKAFNKEENRHVYEQLKGFQVNKKIKPSVSPKIDAKKYHQVPSIKFIGIFDTVSGLSEEEDIVHDISLNEKFHSAYCHLMASNLTASYPNETFSNKILPPRLRKKVCENRLPSLQSNKTEIACPGDHACVGGGWDEKPETTICLSNSTLKLMAVCAKKAGLRFFPELQDRYPTYNNENWHQGLRSLLNPVDMYRFSLTEWSIYQVLDIFKERASRLRGSAKVFLYRIAQEIKASTLKGKNQTDNKERISKIKSTRLTQKGKHMPAGFELELVEVVKQNIVQKGKPRRSSTLRRANSAISTRVTRPASSNRCNSAEPVVGDSERVSREPSVTVDKKNGQIVIMEEKEDVEKKLGFSHDEHQRFTKSERGFLRKVLGIIDTARARRGEASSPGLFPPSNPELLFKVHKNVEAELDKDKSLFAEWRQAANTW
eukprot:CAMPEP_0167752186 /NCGR_PEP_ID=MMETSP0110_2-20121227/6993_1 /TAXON_ID=629695 /ORGANISM="Gymnochlora sp., Strain CCMP2014" /LENGTH=571 /DNA_ID=CAMNT_0007637763 /DNA_START=883 /DNA_END=2598 /DNA_ORIENTATION=-